MGQVLTKPPAVMGRFSEFNIGAKIPAVAEPLPWGCTCAGWVGAWANAKSGIAASTNPNASRSQPGQKTDQHDFLRFRSRSIGTKYQEVEEAMSSINGMTDKMRRIKSYLWLSADDAQSSAHMPQSARFESGTASVAHAKSAEQSKGGIR